MIYYTRNKFMDLITRVELKRKKIIIESNSGTRIIRASDHDGSYFLEFDTSKLIGKQLIDIIKKNEVVSKDYHPDYPELILETYQLVFLLNNEYLIINLVKETEDDVDIYARWR